MMSKNSHVQDKCDKSELTRLLLREHSKANSMEVVQLLESGKASLRDLIQLFSSNDKLIAQRASTTVNHYFSRHTDEITSCMDIFLEAMDRSIHPSIRRNVMRLLQFVDIPEQYRAPILNRAYEYLLNPKTPIAVQVFSLQVIANISQNHQDLKAELLSALDIIEQPSCALEARVKRVIKQLNI
ncbi:MAG: hypothetical protein R3275_07685 [Saprospiraceae bacterium]|nr:hypothetical protein [Saprospiraceae bacterium]